MRRTLLVFFGLVCACSSSSESAPSGSTGEDALRAGQINGGSTGAMVRQTTPAGFTCITSTVTVPDYDPTQKGDPWVYYGIGDESSVDMEAGLAFQRGDGTAAKPHRWLAYLREGSSFLFTSESSRALPGDTFTLEARLENGQVTLSKDGARLSFLRGSGTVDAIALAVDPAHAHVRRVVGQAVSTSYGGEKLGTLGPVVFQGTQACATDGTMRSFHEIGNWKTSHNGVILGTALWPASGVHAAYDADADSDTITLFP